MVIKKVSKEKWITVLANGFIYWTLLLLLFMFYVFHKESKIFKDAFEHNQIYLELHQPFFEGGMILIIGLFFMTILKGFKKNLLVVFIGILTLLIYYWKIKFDGI